MTRPTLQASLRSVSEARHISSRQPHTRAWQALRSASPAVLSGSNPPVVTRRGLPHRRLRPCRSKPLNIRSCPTIAASVNAGGLGRVPGVRPRVQPYFLRGPLRLLLIVLLGSPACIFHAGTLVVIRHDSGYDMLVFRPSIAYQQLLFSDAGITRGETYTVYSGVPQRVKWSTVSTSGRPRTQAPR